MESVIYGKPATEALREEAKRLDAKRVYLIVSRRLNTKTDEIEKIPKALGNRYAENFDCRRPLRIDRQKRNAVNLHDFRPWRWEWLPSVCLHCHRPRRDIGHGAKACA
jgi:hypothetical protein